VTLIIKIKTKTWLPKEYHSFSRIISFEKKPVEKTNPINLIRLKIELHKIRGENDPLLEYCRKSWILKFKWRIPPTFINKRDLKKAWVTKWKYLIIFNPNLKETIINASWFKVERATNFLKSLSTKENIPE